MQSIKMIENAVLAVVEGDLDAVPLIIAAQHSDLLQAARNLPNLTIKKAALIRVLTTWNDDKNSADTVQQWASFVKRGVVCRWVQVSRTLAVIDHEQVESIDIDYDENDEGLIADIISRFDELGDEIDGEIEQEERLDMLKALSA